MEQFFVTIRDIFPYALLIYLVFFLLEVLLPGFVSNNFDLNYVLVTVLILGFFSVFAPIPEKVEETPQKSDRNLIAILTILSFIVLFFRTRDMGVSGLVIAIVGSLIVAGMSVMIIYFPDQDEKEVIEEIKTEDDAVFPSIQRRRFNLSTYLKHGIVLLITMIIVIFFAYKQVNKKAVSTNQKVPSPTVTVSPTIEEVVVPSPLPTPDEKTLKQTLITILNGTDKVGSASAMAAYLRAKKFSVEKTADADRDDYKNALVRFREQDAAVAEYLVETLNDIYLVVDRLPLTSDSSQIILILGKQ